MVWWDEKNVYLIHKVITLRDNIARAVIYARASCLKVNVHEVIETVSSGTERPPLEDVAPDYRKWMETLELSSQLMKANGMGNGNGGSGDKLNTDKTLRTDKKSPITEYKENGGGDNILSCVAKPEQYASIEKINLIH